MRAFKKALIAAASVGALAVMAAAPAQAAVINFRWNPSASSPALTLSPSIFTSNVLTIGDWAKIDFTTATVHGDGSITGIQENAILNVTALNQDFSGGDGISPLLPNGAPANPSGYQLYFQVSTTSNLAPDGTGGLAGTFTSINYSLIGVKGGGCTFDVAIGGPTATGANCTGANLVTLATGGLVPGGLNDVGIDKFNQPHASVDATIVGAAGTGGFFVSPSNLSTVMFEDAFTNAPAITYYCTASGTIPTGSQTGTGCTSAANGGHLDFANGVDYILIDGGGGDVHMLTIPVPEPVTLSVFGAGLVGAAALRRRKAKKA